MANKGTKNFFGNAKSWIDEKLGKKEDAENKEGKMISESFGREKMMIAKLQEIKLDDPRQKLSQAKIQELGIQKVVDILCKDLKFPLITDRNLENMDEDILSIIALLDDAVREGFEQTAEWACTALMTAIKELRTDVPDVYREYATEFMECRAVYLKNLYVLVQEYWEYETAERNKTKLVEERRDMRTKLDNDRDNYLARRDSGELVGPLDELETNIHQPGLLSDAALKVRDELNSLHVQKSKLIEKDTAINAEQVKANMRDAQIATTRNILASPPHYTDSKLNDRIDQANKCYREQLRNTLNQIEDALKNYDVHISAMRELRNHSVFIRFATVALEMDRELQREREEQRETERAAEMKRIQASELRARAEEKLRAEEEEHLRILAERRNQIVEPVVVQETDNEQLCELE